MGHVVCGANVPGRISPTKHPPYRPIVMLFLAEYLLLCWWSRHLLTLLQFALQFANIHYEAHVLVIIPLNVQRARYPAHVIALNKRK